MQREICFIYWVNPVLHPDILTQVYNKYKYLLTSTFYTLVLSQFSARLLCYNNWGIINLKLHEAETHHWSGPFLDRVIFLTGSFSWPCHFLDRVIFLTGSFSWAGHFLTGSFLWILWLTSYPIGLELYTSSLLNKGSIQYTSYHVQSLICSVYHKGSIQYTSDRVQSLICSVYHKGSIQYTSDRVQSLICSVYHKGSIQYTSYHVQSLICSVYHKGSIQYTSDRVQSLICSVYHRSLTNFTHLRWSVVVVVNPISCQSSDIQAVIWHTGSYHFYDHINLLYIPVYGLGGSPMIIMSRSLMFPLTCIFLLSKRSLWKNNSKQRKSARWVLPHICWVVSILIQIRR